MKPTLHDGRRLAAVAALACGAILLPTAVLVAAPALGAPTALATCRAANTEVWAAPR